MARKKLSELLSENAKTGKYPMHMPGHKRNIQEARGTLSASLFPYDITEIEGFDDLHDAHGVLAEIEHDAASLYRARAAHILVGGSTCGILASVRAATHRGDKMLVMRASHRSVYHAIELCGLSPVYMLPELEENGLVSSITPEQVEEAFLQNEDISAVLVTSPTYEGVVSDIEGIADVAHKHGATLIVDSAHGAHRGLFGNAFGTQESCGYKSADLIVLSLHKTLPSLTQTALLLSNLGKEKEKELCRQLAIFQTSSPSYILMASVDDCLGMLTDEMFESWKGRLLALRDSFSELKALTLVSQKDTFYDYDISKLVISTRGTNMTGEWLSEILRRCEIEPEMIGCDYAVLMTSPLDTQDGYDLVRNALFYADSLAQRTDIKAPPMPIYTIPPRVFTPSEAVEMAGEEIPVTDAEGRISLSYIWAYPPGIPLIAPGELATREVTSAIQTLQNSGVKVKSEKLKVKS